MYLFVTENKKLFKNEFVLVSLLHRVYTRHERCDVMQQKTTEAIIISDVAYTGCGTTRHNKSQTVNQPSTMQVNH